MKTSLTLLLLTISIYANSQVFITLEPAFLRPGVLYNLPTKRPFSVYGKAWYGNIKGEHPDGGKFYTDNIKVGMGVSHKEDRYFTWYVGVNYNYFFNTKTDERICRLDRINRVSIDIGASLRSRRFTLLFLTDPLNWESSIGVSYILKKNCIGKY
jgi:hypothetical protein